MFHTIHGDRWRTRLYVSADMLLQDGQSPEVYLAKLGHFESLGDFTLQQIPSEVSVHLIASGQGTIRTATDTFAVGAGDVFVFFPGEHIQYHDHPGTPWVYTWFMLRGQRASSALQQCGFSPQEPYRRGGNTTSVTQALLTVEDVLAHGSVTPLRSAELALHLLNSLMPAHPSPRVSLAERALALCDQREGLQLNVSELAAALQVSRVTLYREFQDTFGESPKQVLDAARLKQALHLLEHSASPVQEVAAACGYRKQAYFSRVFRARFGMSPRAWRRRWAGVSLERAR